MDKVSAVDVSKCCLGFEAATTSSIKVTFHVKLLLSSKAVYEVTLQRCYCLINRMVSFITRSYY